MRFRKYTKIAIVHGGIRHLENKKMFERDKFRVHGGIRHLEKQELKQ